MIFYEVNDEFPAIRENSFVGGILPKGIQSITYTLSLDGVEGKKYIGAEGRAMKYKTIDLCAGIGGIRRGFELTGQFENVLSAEIGICIKNI